MRRQELFWPSAIVSTVVCECVSKSKITAIDNGGWIVAIPDCGLCLGLRVQPIPYCEMAGQISYEEV